MKIKGIIIDVGGVLVQNLSTDKHVQWEKRLRLRPGQLIREIYSEDLGNKATIGIVSSEYVWEDFKKRFNLSAQDVSQLQLDFYSGDTLNVELYNYIKSIREKYKIVILSDAWGNARNIYTDKYNLDRIVDRMILSGEEGLRKPDEKFIKLAIDFLNIPNEDILYIDDSLMFINQAKLLGINTVHFTSQASSFDQIKRFLSID